MANLSEDDRGKIVPLMEATAPQTLTVEAAGGTAVLSAAVGKRFVRLYPTVDMFFLCTVSTAVTAATGHFISANEGRDIPMTAATTKISLLGAGSAGGTCYLSELG